MKASKKYTKKHRKAQKRREHQEKILEYFPILLLKFCEKEAFARDVLDGKLYMKESGYFRRLEDDYRGDPNDGKMPIDIGNEEMYLESEDGERIYLNGVPWAEVRNFVMGFEGDDKIPLFCACILTKDLLVYRGSNRFKINAKYMKELQKFGKYIAVVSYAEFEQKINRFIDENPEYAAKYGRVSYTDIQKAYGLENAEDDDQFVRFFNKDVHYKYQNEFRMLFVAREKLIGQDCDHWICDVGKFESGYIIPTNKFLKGWIRFKKRR